MNQKLHILTAVAVITREDGRILLLKRADWEKVYPGAYTFPGGKVEDNDTITETLVKEVREECGLVLNPGIILIKEKAIGRPDGSTSKSLSFLCSVKSTENIVLEPNDFTDYKWVNLDELRELEHVGIEAEFIKANQITSSGLPIESFYSDTDKVDFR
jgi:8-oxo-dGTP diphosphatase